MTDPILDSVNKKKTDRDTVIQWLVVAVIGFIMMSLFFKAGAMVGRNQFRAEAEQAHEIARDSQTSQAGCTALLAECIVERNQCLPVQWSDNDR